MGRTGIRSRGPGNLLADFYNKICQQRSLRLPKEAMGLHARLG